MTGQNRADGRTPTEIRPVRLTRDYLSNPEGSCLVEMGRTRVITTATVENTVPQWLKGAGTGWVTAEYGMLPRASGKRTRRPSISFPSGRSLEIQRLIGRSLRAVTDLAALGERTVIIDCDVIDADGGTRTASIIGAAVALHDAATLLAGSGATGSHIVRELVAAVSVGIMPGGAVMVDLCYDEDSNADVDMNIVMTESGRFVEVQGTAEGTPFDRDTLDSLIEAGQSAVERIIAIQKTALGLP